MIDLDPRSAVPTRAPAPPISATTEAASLTDSSGLAAGATYIGQRLSKSVVTALSGTLLTGAVTAVLSTWGRLYYDAELKPLGSSRDMLSIPFTDLLLAPLRTTWESWEILTALVFALGIIGASGALVRWISRGLVRRLRGSKRQRVRRLTQFVAPDRSVRATEDQRALDAHVSAAADVLAVGVVFCVAALLAMLGCIRAAADGAGTGEAIRLACVRGERGHVISEAGVLVGAFCTRLGDDVITYRVQPGAFRIDKWDKQHVEVLPPSHAVGMSVPASPR